MSVTLGSKNQEPHNTTRRAIEALSLHLWHPGSGGNWSPNRKTVRAFLPGASPRPRLVTRKPHWAHLDLRGIGRGPPWFFPRAVVMALSGFLTGSRRRVRPSPLRF